MNDITVRIVGIENLHGVTLPETITVHIEAPDQASVTETQPEERTFRHFGSARVDEAEVYGRPVRFSPREEFLGTYAGLGIIPGDLGKVVGRVGRIVLTRFGSSDLHVYREDLTFED